MDSYDSFFWRIVTNRYISPEDTVSLTGRGCFVINVFAKRERVEELWQYDCRDEMQMRMTVERHVTGSMVSVQTGPEQRRLKHG
jgi:hypothetical protein